MPAPHRKQSIVREETEERNSMRIAVASKGLEIAPTFGQHSGFTCYGITRGMIVACQNMPADSYLSLESLIALLHRFDISVLIAGTIDAATVKKLQKENIEVVPNQSGTARQAVERYLTHTLIGFDDNNEELIL